MKLSTTCIAALATATFLVAVSAQSACDTIADATQGFGIAVEALGLIFEKVAPLQVFFSVTGVVANLACAVDFLTSEKVEKISECIDRVNDLDALTNGVDKLTITICANNLPTPSDFTTYATIAAQLEGEGISIGYQAALLNVDLAVIKLAY